MIGTVRPGKHVDLQRVHALAAQMSQRDRWPRAQLREYQRSLA